MGNRSELATPENTDEESGGAFTDGDFGDSDDDTTVVERGPGSTLPVAETVNAEIVDNETESLVNGKDTLVNGKDSQVNGKDNLVNGKDNQVNGHADSEYSDGEKVEVDGRRDSHSSTSSIVGILGDQQNHAEQRLAARRAARAEAREIRMRELERQQREQEDHADKAYDMYAETVGRRAGGRLAALSPAAHSPRRASEDSDDVLGVKDLRHELKEVEEKFRKAMILTAQLDNDKAALGYRLELLADRLEELHEEHAQLQREHRDRCSAHERLRREHEALERELTRARDAIRARDSAAAAAGFAYVDAAAAPDAPAPGESHGSVPPLALVSHASERLLDDAGEGTLDVRLQNLVSSKQALEGEVRKLKLQLNDERAARQNGAASHHDREHEGELETLRKAVSEAKARAARAEAEAALQAAAVARLEAQVGRLRAQHQQQDENEEQLKQERRKLQREEVLLPVVDFWAEINNDDS